MNLSRLRLITFDVTDTLLKFRTAPGKQYGEIGAMYGILVDNNTLSANFKTHWRKMNDEHPNFGLFSGLGWERWWKQIIIGTFKDSKINLDEKKLDAVSSHLIEAYQTSTCWQPCYGALDLLSYLRHKRIPMGIVSNFDPRLSTTLENTKLRHYFKFVLTSYETGIEKPDARIFKMAMDQSGVDKLKGDECLHIGDTVVLDYKGAKNAGWHGYVVHERDPSEMQVKYGFVKPTDVFRSLYDLHKSFVASSTAGQSLQQQLNQLP